MRYPFVVDAVFVAIVTAVAGAIVLGFGRAARFERGGPSPARVAWVALGVVSLVACLDVVAALSGWTAQWLALPPRIPGLALGALSIAGLALCTKSARALLPALPAIGLVAFQSFRFPLELVLFTLAKQDRLPPQMTFEGRNFDVLVGLSAPFVAWALARKAIGWRTVIAWNLGSLALLLNVTFVAVRSTPGPLFAFPEAAPLTLVGTLPYTWLPGILVPVAYLCHFLSLRSALAERAPLEGTNRASLPDDLSTRSPAP